MVTARKRAFDQFVRRIMMLAAFAFAFQGVSLAHATAGEAPKSGLPIWHTHEDDDGSRHVHVHRIDEDGGGHYDKDGKLKAGSAQVAAALPGPFNAPLTILPEASPFLLASAQLPSGLDPGGPRRPPRTPDIA